MRRRLTWGEPDEVRGRANPELSINYHGAGRRGALSRRRSVVLFSTPRPALRLRAHSCDCRSPMIMWDSWSPAPEGRGRFGRRMVLPTLIWSPLTRQELPQFSASAVAPECATWMVEVASGRWSKG